jgi:hypothetical protein
MLCRDPRLPPQITTAVDQSEERVELHYVQAGHISDWFKAQTLGVGPSQR